jgi:hypothetical protein
MNVYKSHKCITLKSFNQKKLFVSDKFILPAKEKARNGPLVNNCQEVGPPGDEKEDMQLRKGS